MVRKTLRKERTDKFWKRVNDFLMYDHLHNFPHKPFLLKQHGGGIITIGNKQFEYFEHAEDDGILIIKGSSVDATMPCFILKICPETPTTQRHAEMTSITRGVACSLDKTAKSKEIVCAVVNLAKEKKAKWIEFTDMSSICKDENKSTQSISLADYYFLTRGKTWYETICKFIPDERYASTISYYREFIQENSWADMIKTGKRRYRAEITKMLRDLPVDLTTIDVNAPGSVMTVLRRIPPEKRCEFFYKYSYNLLLFNDIGTLFNSVWYLPLADDCRRNVIVTTTPYDSVNFENENVTDEGGLKKTTNDDEQDGLR